MGLRKWVSGKIRAIAREVAKEEIKNIKPSENKVSVKIPIFNDKGQPGWQSVYWNSMGSTRSDSIYYGEQQTGSTHSYSERAYKEYPLQDFLNELNKDEKIRWIIPACRGAHIQVKK